MRNSTLRKVFLLKKKLQGTAKETNLHVVTNPRIGVITFSFNKTRDDESVHIKPFFSKR